MLVLCRKKHEEVVLPEQDISIMIVAIEDDQVRLGISAPRHIPVHRKEVWMQIQQWQESHAAACPIPDQAE